MRNIAYYLVLLVFLISFTKGGLELLGISETILQLSIDSIIFFIFFISLIFISQNKTIVLPGGKLILIFFVIIVISFLLNNVSLLQLGLFLRKFTIYILFFYSIMNISFEENQKERILNLLIFLFFIQIIAAFVKLFVLGSTLEKIVGIMSVLEGSLATIMPLLAISYLISIYLYENKLKYIIFILLFIAIGLISNKLGILFYLFILFLFLTFIYTKKISNSRIINLSFIKYMLKVATYLIIIFVLFVSLNPRANPEHKVGGSIDLDYLSNYVENYNTLKLKGSKVEGDGRADAPIIAFTKLSNGGILNILLGYGPGDIVQSSFLSLKDPLLEKYNIGYGGRLGQVWIMMQLGIIGLISFSLFQIYLFVRIYSIYNSIQENKKSLLILSIIGILIVFFLDFFTYSSQILYSPGVTLFYYFSIYYALTFQQKEEKE